LHLFDHGGRVLRQWDPARGLGLRSFVALVARRETVGILRNRRRSPWTEDPTELETLDRNAALAAGPELEAIARELLAVVTDRVCARLSPRGVEMFQLLLLHGCETTEVCVRTALRPDRVHEWRSRLSRSARETAAGLISDR
jgi:RNA polymerase sigma-70 factor, ECF subfamily